MTPLFKKLNFKNQSHIISLYHPETFILELDQMAQVAKVIDDVSTVDEIEFVITFAQTQEVLDRAIGDIVPLVKGDALVWFAYPKKSSKRYQCEFDRDNGWTLLGENGFEPVRAVAIDEDWSALRFRKVEYIKKMTRGFAISREGQKKVSKK